MEMKRGQKEQTAIKLSRIRQRMREEKIDAYLVVSSDFHGSEYVGDFFKCREYVTGFTGSAGRAVILQNEAGLWTDGRYFLQAEEELAGSGIGLYRIGEDGVPELEDYLEQKLAEGACLGVDGRTVDVRAYRKLEKKLSLKKIRISPSIDFVGEIWKDRQEMPCEPAWELDLCYAGRTRAEKLKMLREKLEEEGADCTVISTLDDIAWALNVRGGDIACTPVALGFFVLGKEYAIWFVQQKAVGAELAESLEADGVLLRDYHGIYGFLQGELECRALYLDPGRTNMMVYEKAKKRLQEIKGRITEGKNLTLLPKAMKNSKEIENIRKAHVKDGVACTKFLYWLKKNVAEGTSADAGEQGKDEPCTCQITEVSAAKVLEGFRRRQDHYLGPSFDTIVGYAQHGAIVHYHAMPDTDIPLKPGNMVLVDSGGHYMEGTTDVTRTVALGALTREQKHHYTLVLKGNLRLAAAEFKYGCAGINLDHIAREPLWEERLDFNHGTGHGVGYLLSVHEPPNSFRSQVSESRDECMKLEEGMVTSNEPGLYLEGKYGIRLENLIACREIGKNAYGRFMGFETLTLVPFDREAILPEELDEKERTWLNAYHARVFATVGPYLDEGEWAWLKEATAAL